MRALSDVGLAVFGACLRLAPGAHGRVPICLHRGDLMRRGQRPMVFIHASDMAMLSRFEVNLATGFDTQQCPVTQFREDGSIDWIIAC